MYQKNPFKDAEKIVVVSDFHLGAMDSIKRECFINNGHEECKIPVGMSKLHKHMDGKWKNVEEQHSDARYVFHLGDQVEGGDEASLGQSCWTTDLDLQALCAAELFYSFDDAVHYGVQGSGYHSRNNPSMDKKVLDILGGYFGKKEYEVPVGGVTFHLRHFAGYTKNKKTRASTLGEDLLKAEINKSVYEDVDVFLRGHCHYFVYQGWAVPNRLAIICPGFKGRDVFVAHRGLDIPDCGHLTFYVVDGRYTWTHDVWQLPKEMLVARAPVIPREDRNARNNRFEAYKAKITTKNAHT